LPTLRKNLRAFVAHNESDNSSGLLRDRRRFGVFRKFAARQAHLSLEQLGDVRRIAEISHDLLISDPRLEGRFLRLLAWGVGILFSLFGIAVSSPENVARFIGFDFIPHVSTARQWISQFVTGPYVGGTIALGLSVLLAVALGKLLTDLQLGRSSTRHLISVSRDFIACVRLAEVSRSKLGAH
jgi:hypothetical protein